MSFDTPADNQAWAIDEGFQFELWSDTGKTLALTYGAASSPQQNDASRVTMLLDANCDLVLEYTDSVAVGTHPSDVLEDAQKLFGTP